MYFLYSFFWFVSAGGDVGMASHDITPNLTYDQCKTMKEYVIEQFESQNVERDNTGNFLSANSQYVVECKPMDANK